MVAVSLKKIFFKQKTAYEIADSDWSSDVCSSDLRAGRGWAGRGVCLCQRAECGERLLRPAGAAMTRSRSLSAWCVDHPIATVLLTFALVLLGLIAFPRLPVAAAHRGRSLLSLYQ